MSSPFRTTVTVTCLVALCVPILVSGLAAAQDPAGLARIDELAAAAVRDGSVAGMTIAVARGPRIVLERHYGRADLELDTRLPDNPVYEVGSVSKQFWEKEQTKADVETLILDHVYTHFPDPPFSDEEKKLIAANVYAHVWQQAVSDGFARAY